MTISNSRLSYLDCYELFDAALADQHGARRRMADGKAAHHYRMRMNQARQIDRKDNAATYPQGHQMYGCSVYDKVIVRIKHDEDGDVWIYVEHIDYEIGKVEALANKPLQVEHEEVLSIEDQTPGVIKRRI